MSNPKEDVFPVDENDLDVVVTLDLDNGESLDCEIVTIFTLNDRDYIALLPVDQNGEPYQDEVLLYRYSEDEAGTPAIDNIATDEEYDRVGAFFASLFNSD